VIALLRRNKSAEANLSTEENPPKKSTWFSNTDENSWWTEGIKTEATQGSLQVSSIGVPHLSVRQSNEKGTAPNPEESVYLSLQSGQILGK
jgi:hypothetical protein